jgi:hypothetical protein
MDEFGEAVQDACVILAEVNDWRLPPTDWVELAQLIENMSAAFAAADAKGIYHAIEELDLYTPDRAIPLGADRAVAPAPPPLRERVNQLVHTLGGDPRSSSHVEQPRTAEPAMAAPLADGSLATRFGCLQDPL